MQNTHTERDTHRDTHTHIYIYIYIERERGGERERRKSTREKGGWLNLHEMRGFGWQEALDPLSGDGDHTVVVVSGPHNQNTFPRRCGPGVFAEHREVPQSQDANLFGAPQPQPHVIMIMIDVFVGKPRSNSKIIIIIISLILLLLLIIIILLLVG